MISFKVETKNVLKVFQEAKKAMTDFSKPLKEVRRYQLKQINEAFNVSGKNIIGKPWKSLRPGTIKSKLKAGFTTRILERTGKMRRSFRSTKLTKRQLSITSIGVPYYPKHQQGERGATFKPNIPQRQILGHSPEMVKQTLKIFSKYIIKSIKKWTI
jgi:phage gpG-like protein